ncbi:DUF1269 domain-containing protein [Cellulomonas hominis]|uniref:DUF1269 domain-containing protein n=1 Tax=Cellulomonas hominis TaxID=156981 RepID=UPI001BA25E27|nr:DUF1269 domain-containing protein [Cellulomonas hominis]VTR75528.1 hypothetical protein CHMI_00274 [Cellulomonas hominis]
MTTFTAWKFDTPEGADKALGALHAAQDDGLVKVVDSAVVSWPVGEKRPELHHQHDEGKRKAGWGALWGLLVGGLFFAPLLGAAAGAGIGALAKSVEGVGINEDDLTRLKDETTEGTSLLLTVTQDADMDRLGERFHGLGSRLVSTNLTQAERDLLLETFG